MTNRALSAFLVAAVAFTIAITGHVNAAVIYDQNFDTPDVTGGTGDPLGTYAWIVHRNENGANSVNTWPFDPVSGSGSQARVVNDTAAPSASDRVFTFWNDGADGEDLLLWSEDFTAVPIGGSSDMQITWFQRDSGSSPAQRAAIAINTGSGRQWYAGDLNTNTTANWVQNTALLADSIWVPFSFDGTVTGDASSGFDVSGAAGALPTSGDIEAVGIYVELADDDAGRIDSFEFSGQFIPEPTTAALLGLAGLALIRRRRAP